MAHAKKKQSRWPLYLIGASAAVAVWSGWVGLGGLSGFGLVHPLPGIWDSFHLNTAITLPIGVEAYGAYALGAWIDRSTPRVAKKFAQWSAIGSLLLGMLGQIAFHLLTAAHKASAPWEIVTVVSCLPVITLGLAAALHHLIGQEDDEPEAEQELRLTPREMDQLDRELDEEPHPMPKLESLLAEKPPWDLPYAALHPVYPEPAPEPSLPTMAAPVQQPAFTPAADTGMQPALGSVSVRNPLSRAERKVPVDERVTARLTGSFPAIPE